MNLPTSFELSGDSSVDIRWHDGGRGDLGAIDSPEFNRMFCRDLESASVRVEIDHVGRFDAFEPRSLQVTILKCPGRDDLVRVPCRLELWLSQDDARRLGAILTMLANHDDLASVERRMQEERDRSPIRPEDRRVAVPTKVEAELIAEHVSKTWRGGDC